MSNKKDKVGRPSSGKRVKSQGKNGVMDITRKITGQDGNDLFEATRKDVERIINDIRNVTDIPKKVSLDEKNLEEFSKLINKITTNGELREINRRITKPNKKATLEDYDTMIKAAVDIINERDDNDYEKKILNRHVNNSNEEIGVIKEIRVEVNRLLDGLYRASEIMRAEEGIKCFLDIRDKLEDINNYLNTNIEMYRVLQERIKKVSEKYPEIEELEEININDIDSLNIDFIGEVLGLPTTKEMQDIIKREIENGEI